MKNKKKIIYVAEPATVNTGFGTVSKSIVPALASEFEIHALCTGGYGKQCLEGLADYGVTHATWTEKNDLHGIEQLNRILKEYDPDGVFTYYDVGSVTDYIKKSFVGNYPHASYLITEGEPMMIAWRRLFKDEAFRSKLTRNKFEIDSIILPSNYANEVAIKETGVSCRVAYHGYDHGNWAMYPKEYRKELRQNLMQEVDGKWDLDKTFIVLYCARNAGRKQWPRLFRAFKQAQDLAPEINFKLYAHTKVFNNYVHEGWALNEEVCQAGIKEEDVIFSQTEDLKGIPFDVPMNSKDPSLAKIYNLADLYVHPSSIEGAGLPLLEAARCGLPVLTTEWGGGWDYAKEYAMGLKVSDFYHHSSGAMQALVDIKDMAEKIVLFARNKSLWHQYSGKSLKNCNYTWKNLQEQSIQAMSEAIKKAN